MSDAFERVVDRVGCEAPRRHARWDANLFGALCAGPGRRLWQGLAGQPTAEPVLAAYLELVREAVATGYLRAAAGGTDASCFLALCLLRLLPESLGTVAAAERLPLLVKVWNLGEGLLRQPAWVDRYVVARAAELPVLADVEEFLLRVLEPALAPAAPSAWAGPFAVAVLDARPLCDEFLPGPMHLAAPAVLCVHDRRQPGVQLGVFLRPGRQSRFMGLTPCLGAYPEEDGLPRYAVEEKRLRVGGQAVELPLLRRPQAGLLARAGFAVVSGVDSQRLWVVESA
jgi:hypothetical protein